MGLFDKAKQAKQSAADAMAQATAMQQQAGVPAGGLGGADMPGMGGQDMAAAMAAMSAKMNKLAQSGVEAPGVIHTITATGTPDVSGATMHAIAVTYRPEGGDPIETTIEQSLLPFQLETMAEGKPCTVKYDPDMPSSAILHSW
jgi:DNA-binding LytR/AlgR family response regulator